MQKEYNISIITQLLREGREDEVFAILEPLHHTEIAEILSNFSEETIISILFKFPRQRIADIFIEFSFSEQAEIAQLLGTKELVALLRSLSPDDQADFFNVLSKEQYDAVLPELAKKEREDLVKLASYPEGSAGSVMNTDYIAYPQYLSIKQVLERIRLERTDKEAVYRLYVIDGQRRLVGTLPITDLILTSPEKKLEEVMRTPVVSISVDTDQEEAVYMMARYDLVALPVVDEDGLLLGSITHDDALDVIEEERTADMERFMAIVGKPDDTTYLKTSIWSHFKKRIGWLVILAVLGLISGGILQRYESTLMSLMILAFYMPMLIDTGGNTGSQSATVIVRSLALKEISPKHAFKVVWKELQIALLLSLVLGGLAFVRVVFATSPGAVPEAMSLMKVGFSIAIALALQVLSATILGALLPLGAAALKLDPALVASPALTTIVDITGLFIYFGTVTLILGL
ncbi:MAG: magnesium transporter [Spirochaetales bacterium]|nr:magnesium transporter [Spirochaetales bacterium]